MFTYAIKTTEGKVIKLKTAYIEVSRNPEGGFFTSFKLVGVLPRCRKPEVLTHSYFGGADAISLTTLFGYRAYHHVLKSTMQTLIDEVEVRNRGLWETDFVELTPETVAKAKKIASFFFANGQEI